MSGAVRSAAPIPRALLVAVPLVLTGALPSGAATVAALAAVILLGVPHGALDGEIARTAMRPRWGRWWFPAFALPYLTLSAAVLLAWRLWPLPTLAGFLALSVLHFGAEDAPHGTWAERLVRGGLPIAPAVLLQPSATAALFGAVADVPLAGPPGWLACGAWLWLIAAAVWLWRDRPGTAALLQPGLVIAGYAVLPPITAFALYFICIHAPAHVAGVIADMGRAPRVRSNRDANRLALPLTGLTLLLGTALWFSYAGPAPDRLLELTIQGLAALTLPHMLLDWWTARHLDRTERYLR